MERSESQPSFRNLPWLVRYRVYELLSAVRSEYADLTALTPTEWKGGCNLSHNAESRRGAKQFPIQLMRVCRSFYDDLNSILYSSNAFVLCLHKVDEERMFLALSACSLSLVKDLFIHFGSLSNSLSLEESPGEFLDVFRTVMQHLAKNANLPELSLTVSGINVSDQALANLSRVFSSVSGLKNCSVKLSEARLGLKAPRNIVRFAAVRRIAISAIGAFDIDSFPFGRLPIELQRHILSFTGLALPFRTIGKPQGLEIISGKPQYQQDDSSACCGRCTGERKWPVCCCIYGSGDAFSASCTCYRFPLALFAVSRRVSRLAQETAYSENRIIVRNALLSVFDWLRDTPREFLSQVRALDLIVTSGQLRRWGHLSSLESNVQLPPEWASIASTVDDCLPLNNLTLSIDAAHMYDDLLEDELIYGDAGTEYFESLKNIYRALVVPFASRPHFRQLRNFFVYWPLFGSTEDEAEKAVMGLEYDAQARGKVLYKDRDWRLPHGWEWADVFANGELNQDWLDYRMEYMQDIE
ncbi:Endonuclease III-like protein 1 [Xylographa soralifera]|nr:Endonuclease III-like protein 1 [Xylographa soralifera]